MIKSSEKIEQVCVADSIRFFKNDFINKYKLLDYYDTKKPALFFGGYKNSDLINKHEGYKIILPSTPEDYPNIVNYDKTILICSDNYILPPNVIRKSITPEIKDYSIFKPNILGDKIYFYSGFKNGWNLKKENIDDIQKNIDYELITTSHLNLKDYYSIEYLKENFYDKCFLNINLTRGHGLASVIELGLMGRKTIFKNNIKNNIQRLEFDNFISYENIDNIISIILEESKKIGTIQDSINAHNTIGDEWLFLDFYL
jgi:hypothetical protein